jgi:hypothetical protein
MAYEANVQCIPGCIAGEDMSAKQFYAVVPGGSGGSWIAGQFGCILQNAPKEGEAASVAYAGVSKARVGTGGITAPCSVQADTDGRMINAAMPGANGAWLALETAAEDELTTVVMMAGIVITGM